MQLLNVHDFTIQSGIPDGISSTLFTDSESTIPPYAILSHRWIDDKDSDEVTDKTFGEIPKNKLGKVPTRSPARSPARGNTPQLKKRDSKLGTWMKEHLEQSDQITTKKNRYASSTYKIAGACRQVRDADDKTVRHIWIDTICVDKSNAQETTIAINSMFRWYEGAAVCYVYMYDVTWKNGGDEDSREQFRESEWFQRGWTLQELLAPKKLEFYDRDWKLMGSKQDLVDDISEATSISHEHLLTDFRTASLAQKMSWLAKRGTKRDKSYKVTKYPADLAYCMLGILGVGSLEGLYMDTRYGEGMKEFQRLQREMIKTWNRSIPFDESLFAWKESRILSSGLLAPEPICFRDCGDIIFDPRWAKLRRSKENDYGITFDQANCMTIDGVWYFHVPFVPLLTVLTVGLIQWVVLPVLVYQVMSRHGEMKLNCWVRGKEGKMNVLKIKLEKTEDGTWQRVDCGVLGISSSSRIYPSKYVATDYDKPLKITSRIRPK